MSKVLIIAVSLLLTACATVYDISFMQTQIAGLEGQIDRTNNLIASANESSKQAEVAADKAFVAVVKAEQAIKQVDDRLNSLFKYPTH